MKAFRDRRPTSGWDCSRTMFGIFLRFRAARARLSCVRPSPNSGKIIRGRELRSREILRAATSETPSAPRCQPVFAAHETARPPLLRSLQSIDDSAPKAEHHRHSPPFLVQPKSHAPCAPQSFGLPSSRVAKPNPQIDEPATADASPERLVSAASERARERRFL